MTDVVIEREVIVLEELGESGVLVEVSEPRVDVVTEARQGPPGPPGPQGPVGDADGALLVTARLAEFDTEEAKAEARANIGLAVIDGGTFF